MQLLYVPVQPTVRGRAKAFIDGIFKPTAIAATGAVLLFYKESGGKGRPLTLAVLLLVALWIVLLVRARKEYVRSLVESLERRHHDLSAAPLAATSEGTVRALRAALNGDVAAADPLKALLGAEDPHDRAAAADALGKIGVRGFYRPLVAFLRDRDPMVRRRAIGAAGKLRNLELIPPLVEQFRDRRTALEAAAALVSFGPGIEPTLREVLADEAADASCRCGVALVLQRMGTKEAI